MSISIIRSELTTKLNAWATAQSPVIKLALEGESFVKPVDKASFLEVFILPAATIDTSVDGLNKREIGIFQVNCWTWDNGQGAGKSDRLAQSIVDLFPIVPKLSVVSVERTPSVSQPIFEDGWRIIPVTIQYRYESR